MTFPTTTTEGDPLVTSDPVQLGKAILWVRECVPAEQQQGVLQMLGILPAPTLYCAAGTHVRTPSNTAYTVTGSYRYCRDCNLESRQDAAAETTRKKRTPTHKVPPKGPQTHCKRGHEMTPENTWVHGLGRRCRTCTIEGNARRRAARAEK